MSVKLHEIYYVAGLLEGEGCFGFSGTPNIQLGMTDVEPVRRVRNIISPGTIIKKKETSSNVGYRPYYTFYVGGHLAIQWMMTIYPIMSPRRKVKIEEVLVKWKAAKFQHKPNQFRIFRNA